MHYDVAIIGAGPGGIYSAYELIKQRPDLKGLAASLQTKARDAKASVQKYWAEVKAVKGEEKTGKLAGLRTDITTLQGTSHTHDNAAQLAKLSEDETGNPTYGGTKLLKAGDIDTTEITSSTIDTLWAEVQRENQV